MKLPQNYQIINRFQNLLNLKFIFQLEKLSNFLIFTTAYYNQLISGGQDSHLLDFQQVSINYFFVSTVQSNLPPNCSGELFPEGSRQLFYTPPKLEKLKTTRRNWEKYLDMPSTHKFTACQIMIFPVLNTKRCFQLSLRHLEMEILLKMER